MSHVVRTVTGALVARLVLVLAAVPAGAAELVFDGSTWTPNPPAAVETTGNVVVIQNATFADTGSRTWNQLILRGNATYTRGSERLQHAGAGDAVVTGLEVGGGFAGISILANVSVSAMTTLRMAGLIRLAGTAINPSPGVDGTLQYEGGGSLTLETSTSLNGGAFKMTPVQGPLVLNLVALTGAVTLSVDGNLTVNGSVPVRLRINATNTSNAPKTLDLRDGGPMAGYLDLDSTAAGGWQVTSSSACNTGISVAASGTVVTRGTASDSSIQCLAQVAGSMEAQNAALLSPPTVGNAIEVTGTLRTVGAGSWSWTHTLITRPSCTLQGTIRWLGGTTLHVNGGILPELTALGPAALELESMNNPLTLSGDITSVSATAIPPSVALLLDRLGGGTTTLGPFGGDEVSEIENLGVLRVATGTTLSSSRTLNNVGTLETVASLMPTSQPAALALDVLHASNAVANIQVPTEVQSVWLNEGILSAEAPFTVVPNGEFQHSTTVSENVFLQGGALRFLTSEPGSFTVLGTGSVLEGAEVPSGVVVHVVATLDTDATLTVNDPFLQVVGALDLETQAVNRTARVACTGAGGEAVVTGALTLVGRVAGMRRVDCTSLRLASGAATMIIPTPFATAGTFTSGTRVELGGGEVTATQIINNGTWSGYGTVNGDFINDATLAVAGGHLQVHGAFTQGGGGMLVPRAFNGTFGVETDHVVVSSPHAVSLAGQADLSVVDMGVVYDTTHSLVLASRPQNEPLEPNVTLDPLLEVVGTPPITLSGSLLTDYGTWRVVLANDISVSFLPAMLSGHYAQQPAQDRLRDEGTRLEWRVSHGPATAWPNAVSSCLALGQRWRLPTFRELVTLVDYGTTASPKVFPGVFSMPGGADQTFWSATPQPGGGGVLVVDFATGQGVVAPVDGMHAVRCVRSAPRT